VPSGTTKKESDPFTHTLLSRKIQDRSGKKSKDLSRNPRILDGRTGSLMHT
jgi:hypothetical protein